MSGNGSTPFGVRLVAALGGFLGGACLAGGAVAAAYGHTLTQIVQAARYDPGGGSGIAFLLTLSVSLVAVSAAAVLGGLVGTVMMAVACRRTGKVPIFSYAGFVLAAAIILWQ